MTLDPSLYPNLLIIDDDENIQRLLSIAAQDQGWRPVSAGSGREGLDLLDPGIEAVLLDQGLPGMDGLQTLRHIRDFSATLPVIMLTGLDSAESAVLALRAGADDYVTKPFELKRLFSILRDAKLKRQEQSAAATVPGRRLAKTSLTSRNPGLRLLLAHLAKAARLDCNILLTGESGTGKSTVSARARPRNSSP